MKRIYTLLSLLALGPALFAINGSPVPVDKNAVNVASLKPDDYMHNTLILKVLPEYRSLCSVERINIPAVNDFFLTMGEDQCGKKYPRHEAPKEKFNKYGMPMIDLSLIYEIHYTGAMPMDMAIAKLMNLGFFEYVEPHIIPKISFVPNDPQATQAQSYYLYKIAAAGSGTTGWDIETGNSNVVIGIVDTGTEYTHSDLSNQIKISSTEISGNGIDDDGDGYIDNYRGWDVAMNDNDATWEGNAHGVAVCGDACAQTNNNNKVAGPGYNCKILPVKIADASGTLTAAYDGIVYAADHGCQVINCSWGGPSAGSYGQNIIDYAMNNKDALVVVAAANDGSDSAVYPAAYDNSMSVAATNSSDGKAYFSNYNYTVDVCSPGQGILNTWINNGTISNDGTSMASPVCAGVCAIVRAHYPSYNCYQTKQRVKTTADNIYSVSGNSAYQDKLGTGRINMYRALTDVEGPAVDYTNIAYTDNNDMVFVPNDTMRITGTFINYLGTINNLNTTLTVISGGSYVTILDGSHSVGTLGTMGTATQASDPYQIKINTNCPYNQTIVFKLNMTDGVYSVNKYFSQIVNGDYINITINDIWTTIPSQGRIGFRNSQQSQGLGFCYQGSGTLLYDASLMVGTSSAKVSDMIRGATAGQDDNDFQSQQIVQAITPPVVSDFDAMGVFRDNISPAPLPVTVRHREFAWATAPHRKYIIVQYSIMNTGATTLSNMYAGIFADWDIDASTSGQNRADVDNTNRMGYVYSTVAGGKYCGIKLLTNGAFNNYAIDNISGGGGGVNIYDNFTTAEKYQTLSTSRAQAGTTGQGNDVCHVVSSGPFTVAAGDSIVVAFALIAGDDLSDLQNSAVDAQSMYNNLPLGSPVTVAHITTGLNAFPNPASGMTQISYNVAEGGNTDIRLVDAQGRLVRMLDTGDKSPGAYSVMLDAAELSDGIYFVQMISNGKLTTQKFVVSH